MANTKLSMSKIRQLLRLHTQGRRKYQIAEQTGVSCNLLKKCLKEYLSSGFSFTEIIFTSIYKELKRKGVTSCFNYIITKCIMAIT